MSTVAKSSTQAMQSTLEEDGYVAQIEFDGRAGVFFGKVIGTRDVITFQGKSVDELKQAFRDSIKAYRALSEKRGKEPEKSFSGKIPFRTTPEMHKRIYKAAQSEKKSINAWMNEVLAEAVQRALEPPGTTPAASRAMTPDDQRTVFDRIREYINAIEERQKLAPKQDAPPRELPVGIPLTVPAVAAGVPIDLPLNVLLEGIVSASKLAGLLYQSSPAFYALHRALWGGVAEPETFPESQQAQEQSSSQPGQRNPAK